jgi:Na+/H+-dicarboxylate symporter
MVWALMRTMPIFVFALMAGQIVKSAGTDLALFQQLLSFLLNYSAVVVLGLSIIVFVVYPLLVMIGTGRWNYLFFLRGMRDAQVTAFTTSSSMATLPVTMECVHNKLGVSPRISSFVLPIGATVNMDGTSLYQAVAVVALAQFHGIDLSTAQLMTVAGMATLASIGAAAIPSAGLVLLIIVLESVGLNPAWIALILPVDRILDMCRTAVNVSGDGAVCTVVAKTEGEWNPNLSE